MGEAGLVADVHDLDDHLSLPSACSLTFVLLSTDPASFFRTGKSLLRLSTGPGRRPSRP